MNIVTVIGRGHSGTRAISHTLSASGVFMGVPLNRSGDLLPPEEMYEACRVMSRYVTYLGSLRWDFSKLHSGPIDRAFTRLIESYLSSVFESGAPYRGWKIPETILVYPWIVRMFPEIRYIYWVRDPRDGILGRHKTDDLKDFGIDYPKTDDVYERRAISWQYQHEIVSCTPEPKHFIMVRFEDMVLEQEKTVGMLEEFLGIPLARVEMRSDSVGRFRRSEVDTDLPIFRSELREYGYEIGKCQ